MELNIESLGLKYGIKILPQDLIPQELKIGQKYHVAWAPRGCVWILKGFVGNNQVEMETPKTKRRMQTASSSLRLLNHDVKLAALKRTNKLKSK